MNEVVLAAILVVGLGTSDAAAESYVNGYYRNNGTYVDSHYRTGRYDSKSNNYSTQGNVNPHTGRVGSVNPYRNSHARRRCPVVPTPLG